MAARPTGQSAQGTRTSTSQSVGPSVQTQTSSQTQTGSSSSSSKSTVDMRNMTSSSLAALESLIRGLTGQETRGPLSRGGSEAADKTKQLDSEFQAAVRNAAQLQADYSKSAAFRDADAATQALLAEGIEQAMPQIVAGIDAAGTSGSALSALLTQQAATDAARSAAQLGLDAAVNYGNIAVAAGQTRSGLLQSGDPVMTALLNALTISKGAVQQGTETTNSSSRESSTSTGTTTTMDSGKTATTVQEDTPIFSSRKKKEFEAPASSAVTSNTGGGWQTTYGV